MFEFLKRLRRIGRETVIFDGERIVRTMPGGRTQTVYWDELSEVSIVTTDEGPFVPDVFWLLHGEQGGCAVPSEADGMDALLTELQRLHGFDNEAVIHAMGSTANASFRVWRRPSCSAPPGSAVATDTGSSEPCCNEPADDSQLTEIASAWTALRRRSWLALLLTFLLVLAVGFVAALLPWFYALQGGFCSLVGTVFACTECRLLHAGFVRRPKAKWAAEVLSDGFCLSTNSARARIAWSDVAAASVFDTTLDWAGLAGVDTSAILRLRDGTRLGVPESATGYAAFVRELERRTLPGLTLVPAPFWTRTE